MKRFFLSLVLSVLFIGCASTGGKIVLPSTPTWQAHGIVDRELVYLESFKLLKQFPGISDDKFAVVDFDFTLAMLKWADQARFALLSDGGKPYVLNAWDCETRAAALSLGFSRSAAVAGVQAKPLVAIMSVHQAVEWANVPKGGNHALLLIYTNKGLVVVESQNSTWCYFDDYPNKDQIYNIDLRG